MIAVGLSIFARIFGAIFSNRVTTAITCATLIIGGALTWHRLDKGSAVREAVIEYVAGAELSSARAQVKEANRRALVAKQAAAQFEERRAAAEGEALRYQREIDQYETDNPISPGSVDDFGVFDSLRGN